jgi:type I restriction enzyme R subunit
MTPFTEDNLVQTTTADYLENQLGWENIFAYNNEDFGPDSLLGRSHDNEVILTRYLREALVNLNPNLPETAYDDATRILSEYSTTQSLLQINREKYDLIKDGIQVTFKNNKGEQEKQKLKVIDFSSPENNHFLCVREFWIRGPLGRRRADVMGFVNGIPLVFMELKNVHKSVQAAYEENLATYRERVPQLFHHNALCILGNGIEAVVGAFSSPFKFFREWKRLREEDKGVVEMETLLKGICAKENLIDIIENFVLFDESSRNLTKIVAQNQQYLGVNKAIEAVKNRKERDGKLGVFWHTQGSGKSYSMVFFTRKVHRKLGGNFTFLVLTDRDDLDTQIYKTFAGCALADNDKDECRAASGRHLTELLSRHKAFVFTLIQKFNKDVDPSKPYSVRDDIIVISDEAHRTQYGRLALNMRNAIPNASYIGFTGTPLFKGEDQVTRDVFGDYISTYDFQRAVEDGATVPLYYDARGEKLGITTEGLNERIAEKLDELEVEDVNTAEKLEKELRRDYHIITAGKRVGSIARDFVEHYSTAWESGKAMFVCIDKVTCVRMYDAVQEEWKKKIAVLKASERKITEPEEMQFRERQIAWMEETEMSVVISEEQGEVEKFRKWDVDIEPHRERMINGFSSGDERIDIETAFKNSEHPFRVVFVCAMWLTGFDVKSLSTLYLDKPLKAHTLMQAIARANRVNEGKNNGLIVDYCGILKNLRKALATFAGYDGDDEAGQEGPEPVKPAEDELIADLAEGVALVKALLKENNVELQDINKFTGFERNKAIDDAKEAVNQNDQTRKRFEISCREVFKKFKACINIKPQVNDFRHDYDAINIIYKSLIGDRNNADISDIIQELHGIIDEAIEVRDAPEGDGHLYDISKIDFERLREEFEKFGRKNTLVQNLKAVIEAKLADMLKDNPLRTDFQQHYQDLIKEYNKEKDRLTIEKTFEELMKFYDDLNREEKRHVREELPDQESLFIFDLLKKDKLSKTDIRRIKKVSVELLSKLKEIMGRMADWKANQATRAQVKTEIYNFLYDENTGLPDPAYSEDEIKAKTEDVFMQLLTREAA